MKSFDDWCQENDIDITESKLTAKKRNSLASDEFAIPEKRKYPIEDKSHAINALARVSQFGSEEEKKKVRSAVHKKFPEIKN